MDIYSSRILELAADIKHIGGAAKISNQPILHSTKVSRVCGSQISLELQLDDAQSQIVSFGILPKACALGQASAAILSQNIIGATPKEVKDAREGLFAMLKSGAPPPAGRFWELRYLEPIIDYPPRHASTMLAWDAAVDAIETRPQTH